MSSAQNFPNGLHQGIPHDDGDVGARITFRLGGERAIFRLGESAGSGTDVEFEHSFARVGIGERDVDSLFETGGKERS